MTAPTLTRLSAGTLDRLGARLRVQAPDPENLALAVGLARLYEHEDRLIAAGQLDIGGAFFVQPDMAPTFWPFFGYNRDQEAMEGWWEYAHRHAGALRARWWTALLARLVTGQMVEDDCNGTIVPLTPAIAQRWAR